MPPSLHLPERPSGLQAERVGDHVALTWKTSSETTDGGELRGPVMAVLCRGIQSDTQGISGKLPFCDPVEHTVVEPGESHMVEKLPASLTEGPPRILFYEVELRNEQQRSAGSSAPVYVPAGRAPAAVGPITLVAQARGVEVHWQSEADAGRMRLTRTLVTVGASSAAAANHRTRTGAPRVAPTNAKKKASAPEPVVLEADLPADAKGMLDATALDGGTYTYVAQRIVPVPRYGQVLELKGELSPAATIAYRDVFPPTPPDGLLAIPGGGFGQPVAIDLSWDLSPELKTRGYNVYRAEGSAESFAKVNAQLLPGAAFRDLHVQAGKIYRYRVTAVDELGNESKPSAEVRETASAQ